MKIQTTTASLCYATIGISIGLMGHHLQRQLWRGGADPIAEACTSVEYGSMPDFASRSGHPAYHLGVGLVLGDPLVCMATLQLREWIRSESSAGLWTFGLKLLLQLPATVLVLVEAGRRDHRGLLQWPTLVALLCHWLGTSVVFSSLWMTFYCLSANHANGNWERGVVDLRRGPAALAMALIPALLFVGTIYWPTNATAWTLCAGLLGSPILPLLSLAFWNLKPPGEDVVVSGQQAIVSAMALAVTYAVLAVLCCLGWWVILYTFFTRQVADVDRFYDEILYDRSVRSNLVEVWTLGMAWLTLLACRCEYSALEAVLLTPFVGPGAAVAVELASLEVERYFLPPAGGGAGSKLLQNGETRDRSITKKKKKKKKTQ